jgi:putative transcriptional regulator
MIKCYLSRILGDKKLKVAEIARDTGINKNTLHRLYNETATRVDLEVVEQLCRYLDIEVGELFEIVDDEPNA